MQTKMFYHQMKIKSENENKRLKNEMRSIVFPYHFMNSSMTPPNRLEASHLILETFSKKRFKKKFNILAFALLRLVAD